MAARESELKPRPSDEPREADKSVPERLDEQRERLKQREGETAHEPSAEATRLREHEHSRQRIQQAREREPAAARLRRERENADDIRHDIDETRLRLDRTIDTLQLRLSPRYMTQQTMDKIKHQSTQTGRGFTRLMRENPIPALVSGLGITWLISASMRRGREEAAYRHPHREPASPEDAELRARHALYEAGIEPQGSAYPPPSSSHSYSQTGSGTGAMAGYGHEAKERAHEYGQQARERAQEYGHQAREKAQQYGQQAREKAQAYGHQAHEKFDEYSKRASDTASHMRDRATEMGHHMREQASEAGERIRAGTHHAQDSARDLFNDHPISVGLGVMAAGLALGLLLPSTRQEDKLIGEQRDRLFDQAQAYGSDLAERGQAVAERATEAAKEAADEQGLTGEAAREEGKDIASRAKNVASEASEAAKQEARDQGLTGGGEGTEGESQQRPGESGESQP